ncbi:MAG TPA: cytochrome ubiquinol oxidase subunit II [Burkholderiaceae bacterium]|nr:cytochrome ubiquinol oxidase subunit II [Burkholderiaceae bacterium]
MNSTPQQSGVLDAAPKFHWQPGAWLALRIFSIIGSTFVLSSCAREPLRNLHDHLSFLDPQGPIAAAERWHFWFVVLIMTVLVAAPVYILTIWILWHYRYSNKAHTRYEPKWTHNSVLSVLTWSGPVAIVMFLGVFVWRNTRRLDPFRPLVSTQPTLQVQAIGYNWKWLFLYPKLKIATVGVLPIPAGQPVAMKLTSATVMQSLSIPALIGQIYAMGGMVTQLHFEANGPGRSLGMNTMYNGSGFARQTFTALALKPTAFKAWVKQVQAYGVPLDQHTYALLSQRGTKGQLASALRLPSSTVRDGEIFLRDVPTGLFHQVIHATTSGTTVKFPQMNGVSANAPAIP